MLGLFILACVFMLFMQFIIVLKCKQHKFIVNFYNYSIVQVIIAE